MVSAATGAEDGAGRGHDDLGLDDLLDYLDLLDHLHGNFLDYFDFLDHLSLDDFRLGGATGRQNQCAGQDEYQNRS